jgi:hypothetical protein
MTYEEQIEGYRKLTVLLEEVDKLLHEHGAYLWGKRTFAPSGPYHVRVRVTIDFQLIPFPHPSE